MHWLNGTKAKLSTNSVCRMRDENALGSCSGWLHFCMTSATRRSPTVERRCCPSQATHNLSKPWRSLVLGRNALITKRCPPASFATPRLRIELGSDRVDYRVRDAYHSGQKAGDFDYRRLIGSLALVSPPKEDDPGFRIGFNSGGWLVAEHMIVARYLMYLSLYFHKTKRIFEMHLERFMRTWLQNRFAKAELPSDPAEYVKIWDSSIVADLQLAAYDESYAGHQAALRFHGRSQMRLSRELILAENYRTLSAGRRVVVVVPVFGLSLTPCLL